jgi:hypothetical protein
MSRAKFEIDWIYEIAYHINKGPVIVYEEDLLRLFKAENAAKACYLLSKLTSRYVEYYIQLTDKNPRQVLLDLEKDKR